MGPPKVTPVLMFVGFRFALSSQLGQDGRRRHRRIRQVAKGGSPEGIRAALGNRIYHAAGRATELDVELIGLYLKFLDRLERCPGLRARGRGRVVVGVVAAVEHEGHLVAALTVDANRIGALSARVQLNTWHHGDKRNEIAGR